MRSLRQTLAAGSLFAVYVATAKAGLTLASINPSATPVWPPTGIAIAACLLMGRVAWPAIFAGAFVANLTNAGSIFTSVAIAIGNTVEGILGAYFIDRFAGGRNGLTRAPDVFRFAAFTGFGATAVSATIGVTALAATGFAPWPDYTAIWLTWWLGDAAGALVVAPLVILWVASPSLRSLRGHWLEAILLVAALAGSAAFVFGGAYPPTRNQPLAFLCIPPILWAAFRFSSRETATALAFLSAFATYYTHRGIGPFIVSGTANLVVLQAFMVNVAIMALAIAALVAERRRVEEERLRLLNAEQKARAGAEAANMAKDEFLAMLSHELRNPIAAISTAVHVLSRSLASPANTAMARDVIARQAQHLTRLVDDLLDATRVATGKMTLERRPVDLGAAAANAIDSLEAAGKTARHAVVVDVQPVWVKGDPTRLEQVVTNLVGNALKYTPAGGTVRVTTSAGDGMATLRVVDTGIGIATELAPHVFDLFAQGKRGLDRTEGGLGIGLTLAKRVVELHGGSIELRSEGEGRGSEFVVRLPTAAPSTGEATARWPQEPSVRDRAGRRVLIVEDQADMREILRLALETAGYFVDEAADGPSAVEAVRRIGPDAALVDIGLPGFDGYEVARRVRALAGQPPIILIALTGYGQPDDRRRAESAGFDVHLVKPIEVDRLDALLADCMKTLQPRS